MNEPRPSRSAQVGRFAVVGSIGFFVDAGVLSALLSVSAATPVVARIWSILAAITATWVMNRNLVFHRTANRRREYLQYVLVQGVGAMLNFVIYVWLIRNHPLFHSHPVLAVAVGAGVVLLINFFLLEKWVYRQRVSQG